MPEDLLATSRRLGRADPSLRTTLSTVISLPSLVQNKCRWLGTCSYTRIDLRAFLRPQNFQDRALFDNEGAFMEVAKEGKAEVSSHGTAPPGRF